MIMNEQIAKFRFTGYKIVKSHFEINENETTSEKTEQVGVEVKRENFVDSDSNSFKLIMTVSVKDEKKIIDIGVTMEGYFVFDTELDEQHRGIFFDSNAPAILYPYVRAYVNALTSLSGFNPLILPTINFAARRK